jgi:hypothetical protein
MSTGRRIRAPTTSWRGGVLGGLLLSAGLITHSSPVLAVGERWAELPPPPLAEGAAIHDPVRDRFLFVGGSRDRFDRPTVWSLRVKDPPEWDEVETFRTIPIVYPNAVIYDPVRDRLVTFAGSTSILHATYILRFDTDPPSWEILNTTGTQPSTFRQYSAIYDPVRDRMIVFGGHNTNKVWALSFSPNPTWSELSPTGTPPTARFEHTAIYDPTGDRMIVFGGAFDPFFPQALNESWALSLSGTPAWTFMTPVGSPPPHRTRHSAVLDPSGQRMIVFGGASSSNAYMDDAWALDLTAGNNATWTQLPSQPPGRYSHSACYDPPNTRMLVYGGYSASGDVRLKRTD